MDIKYFRAMKNVDRLSRHLKHRSYNLLEHCYMVGILFMGLANKEGIEFGVKELDIIFKHDILESITSDLPWDIKNYSTETKEAWNIIEKAICDSDDQFEKYSDESIKNSLNKAQYELFKVCDYLDLWIFCKEEQTLGNTSESMQTVISNCEKLITGKFFWVDKFISNYEK